ncbi:hypothetical protein AURANDRAFT_67946 [Aureococcus anophagefferens]|uniref:Uncharacterized protein n=1 Tax=Aureococcus anophagefferens TaxID=44056 RepID=F0YMZ2_AURAN|nr:hypothetical protein AURANDRAFT_67946 [Aureococcus anophagefferens]EGB03511.1 hypothetical protein AURANDRAFT_67946 [Aureococcus anophagefferens]|eukprot:XP_009041778.1 hypothetical protein AURANDRAFT_67946 [Aureococcus anophagefferens]
MADADEPMLAAEAKDDEPTPAAAEAKETEPPPPKRRKRRNAAELLGNESAQDAWRHGAARLPRPRRPRRGPRRTDRDLQWVEQYWNDAKRKTRELCDYTITGLKRQFPLSLASVPISNQRNYMQRSLDIMRALREIGRDGDFAKIPALKKQYKSHRQTSGLAPQAAPRAGRTVTRARRITYARDAANNPAAAARAAD